MNTQTTINDIAALERELAGIAPLVRQGFDRAGGPSPRVEAAIHAEAHRAVLAARARGRFFAWPRIRALAAAAALALLLGGSLHLFTARHSERGAASGPAQAAEGADGYANLLLEIQGLSEEDFFRTEESAALWL